MFGGLKRRLKEYRHPFYMNRNKKYRCYAIGDYTYGRPNVLGGGEGATLTVGKFCSIAARVSIYLGAEHHTDWITTYNFPRFEVARKRVLTKTKGDVHIGNDVWVAEGVTILSGVRVGDGAVIGIGSLVVKDVLPYEIVAGSPARHIDFRFDAETISRLLGLRWWDWDIKKIQEDIDLLLSGNVGEFLKKHGV